MKHLYSNKYYEIHKDLPSFDEDHFYVLHRRLGRVTPSTPDLYMAIGWAESAELARMVEELELDSSGDEWAEEM